MKASEDHISFLDELRGLAILVVFLYHCIAPGGPYTNFQLNWNGWLRDFNVPLGEIITLPCTLGWSGVAIFFVVSGFCIHLSHERSRQKGFDVFFIRRFFRIYPPYLIALLIFALFFPWSKLNFSLALRHAHSEFYASMVNLGTHVALIHNFSSYVAYSINGAFWSIAVEVQLYLIYPLLLLMARGLGWERVLWITGCIEFGLRGTQSYLDSGAGWLILNPFYFWFSWSIGAALAEAYLKKQPLPFAGRSVLFFPALTLLFFFIKPLYPYCFSLAALSTVYLMSYWLTHPESVSTGGGWFRRHLRFAGIVSYSLYLIHQPLITMVFQMLNRLYPNKQAPYLTMFFVNAGSWFLMLIPAYVFYRVIEFPSIEVGRRVIKWRREVSGAPGR